MARSRHTNEHRECLLSGTLRKSCFSAVRAVVDPKRPLVALPRSVTGPQKFSRCQRWLSAFGE
jgi:hypothetical protein